MIQAVLRNAAHPEYGEATIPFPIPEEEYDHCLELLGEQHKKDYEGVFTSRGYAELGGEIKPVYAYRSGETTYFSGPGPQWCWRSARVSSTIHSTTMIRPLS